jgi:hypothetical protein
MRALPRAVACRGSAAGVEGINATGSRASVRRRSRPCIPCLRP